MSSEKVAYMLDPLLPSLPAYNDTAAVTELTEFTASLRSLASSEHPIEVDPGLDCSAAM